MEKKVELYFKEIETLKNANLFLNDKTKVLENEKTKNLTEIESLTSELNSLKTDYLEEENNTTVKLLLFLLLFNTNNFIVNW